MADEKIGSVRCDDDFKKKFHQKVEEVRDSTGMNANFWVKSLLEKAFDIFDEDAEKFRKFVIRGK